MEHVRPREGEGARERQRGDLHPPVHLAEREQREVVVGGCVARLEAQHAPVARGGLGVAAELAARPVDAKKAQTRSEEDKATIDGFVEAMPGGFETLNTTITEAIKKAAAVILDLQVRVEAILADGVARSADEIRKALGDGTDESIFWILRHLTGNKRGFSAQGDWSQPASMRFSKG